MYRFYRIPNESGNERGGGRGNKEFVPIRMKLIFYSKGAQWLCGRVLDSRPKGRGFEPHRRHCFVSPCARHINPTLVLVQPRKTRPDC